MFDLKAQSKISESILVLCLQHIIPLGGLLFCRGSAEHVMLVTERGQEVSHLALPGSDCRLAVCLGSASLWSADTSSGLWANEKASYRQLTHIAHQSHQSECCLLTGWWVVLARGLLRWRTAPLNLLRVFYKQHYTIYNPLMDQCNLWSDLKDLSVHLSIHLCLMVLMKVMMMMFVCFCLSIKTYYL